ncbi:MAG: hypothetical protein PGN26_13280 [Xylophilus ampelinus]
MIGARAKASLDRLVAHGLRNALPGADGADAVVRTEPADRIAPGAGDCMVVLMLASHSFRLVIALHVPRDRATRDYLERVGRITAGDASAQALRDSACESANLCCGTVNREIGRFYPQTGLSTPQVIDGRSAGHMHRLAHQHLQGFRVEVGGARIQATLCAHACRPMDFDWEPEPQPEAAGELELF